MLIAPTQQLRRQGERGRTPPAAASGRGTGELIQNMPSHHLFPENPVLDRLSIERIQSECMHMSVTAERDIFRIAMTLFGRDLVRDQRCKPRAEVAVRRGSSSVPQERPIVGSM